MWQVTDGIAHGSFKLSGEFGHGTYYLKADTQWMKNFYPKTHSIRKIKIVEYLDQNEGLNPGNYALRITSEGGQAVSEIINTIGFHLTNAKGSGIEIKEGKIIDSKGVVILENIKSNEYGMGKFDLLLQEDETYFCELLTLNNQVIRKKIPPAKIEGFSLNVTGNAAKRVISVRTNSKTFKIFRNKKFVLFIHKNGKIQRIPFSLDGSYKSFSLPKEDLLQGVNIITLMTDSGDVLCERLIYNQAEIWRDDLDLKISDQDGVNDSLYLDIRLKEPDKEQITLSVSILSEESINSADKESIHEALLVRPYLDKDVEFSTGLFKTTENKSFTNMDLLMLVHGKSNFSWPLLNERNQTFSHPLENGISVSGRVKNKNLEKIKSVLMYQDNIQGMKSAEIDTNGFFQMSNALIRKEQLVHFSLMN